MIFEFSGGKISVPRQDANVSYEIKNGQPVFSLRRSPRKLAPHLVKHFFKVNMAVLLYQIALFSSEFFQNIQSSQAAHPPLDKTSSLSFPPRPIPPCLNTISPRDDQHSERRGLSHPFVLSESYWPRAKKTCSERRVPYTHPI